MDSQNIFSITTPGITINEISTSASSSEKVTLPPFRREAADAPRRLGPD